MTNDGTLIRCECGVPFIKVQPSKSQIKFLKVIDGLHKPTTIKLEGQVLTIKCPKCGKVIDVKKLIVSS